jgi:uncharacterized membrane protein
MTSSHSKLLTGKLFTAALLAATVGTACMGPSGGRDVGPQGAANCTKPAPAPTGGGAYGLAASGSWADVKSILQKSCVSCHAGITGYAEAKEKIEAIVQVTGLEAGDADFMPRGGQALKDAEQASLAAWLDAGAPQSGTPTGTVTGTKTGTKSGTGTGTGTSTQAAQKPDC